MTSKIFRSTVFVAAVVLLCSLGVVMGLLYNHFSAVQVMQLKDELSLAVTGTEQYGNAFLENVEAERFRITWIHPDGTVLFNTQVDQTTMENHADREEIQEALVSGSGSSVRTSSTLTQQTFYEAQRLKDGTVLRISTSQESAWSLMVGMLQPIVLIAMLAITLSALLARRMADHAKTISKTALEIQEKQIHFSAQAKAELAVLEQAVLDIVERTVGAYASFDLEQAIRVEPQEQVVDSLVREVKSRHVRRLRDGLCTVEYGFVLDDLLTACERTADHCSNVAVEMLQVAEGKLEAHEYLNALKAGELHESAAFTERFARYKARYTFPEEK